jgi:hypothetical protein
VEESHPRQNAKRMMDRVPGKIYISVMISVKEIFYMKKIVKLEK